MSRLALIVPPRGPWPLPALAAWIGAWLVHAGLVALQLPAVASAVLAMFVPAALAVSCHGFVRRALVLMGFPLSLVLAGAEGVPAWFWLLPALLLLALYPVQAWRDAPLYPTRARALEGLSRRLQLPGRPRILDAGCGLGHGLDALAVQWPAASITGLEHSRLLAWFAARRCRHARIVRGDMWRHGWGDYDLVYLFQRPESMPRAWRKARLEMKPGSWLVSLEFAVDGVPAQLQLQQPGERALLAYRIPAPGGRGT
jgi:SAM-dependent methyltransferase